MLCHCSRQDKDLVMACCNLHNFCINSNDCTVPIPRQSDAMNLTLDCVIPLKATQDYRPIQLLYSGNHSNIDFDQFKTRRLNEYRCRERDDDVLQRENM
jgi:hypothetical protein